MRSLVVLLDTAPKLGVKTVIAQELALCLIVVFPLAKAGLAVEIKRK